MTALLFDFLEEALPEGAAQREVHELNENNVLILDLRGASRGEIVDLIVERLPAYLDRSLTSEGREALRKGYDELIQLAAKQRARNYGVGR